MIFLKTTISINIGSPLSLWERVRERVKKLNPLLPSKVNEWANQKPDQNNADHNKTHGTLCKRQDFGIHAINTGNQHRGRKHTWQDRESTNRIVLFRVNESGRGIEQEAHFLKQEGIMFNQRADIFTKFSDIRIINMTA